MTDYRKRQEYVEKILRDLLNLLPSSYNKEVADTNYYKLFRALAQELADAKLAIKTVKDNQYLETVHPDAIYNNFGVLVKLQKMPDWDDEKYRSLVSSVIQSLLTGPTRESIAKAFKMFTNFHVNIYELYKDADKIDPAIYQGYNPKFTFLLEIEKPVEVYADNTTLQRDANYIIGILKPAHTIGLHIINLTANEDFRLYYAVEQKIYSLTRDLIEQKIENKINEILFKELNKKIEAYASSNNITVNEATDIIYKQNYNKTKTEYENEVSNLANELYNKYLKTFDNNPKNLNVNDCLIPTLNLNHFTIIAKSKLRGNLDKEFLDKWKNTLYTESNKKLTKSKLNKKINTEKELLIKQCEDDLYCNPFQFTDEEWYKKAIESLKNKILREEIINLLGGLEQLTNNCLAEAEKFRTEFENNYKNFPAYCGLDRVEVDSENITNEGIYGYRHLTYLGQLMTSTTFNGPKIGSTNLIGPRYTLYDDHHTNFEEDLNENIILTSYSRPFKLASHDKDYQGKLFGTVTIKDENGKPYNIENKLVATEKDTLTDVIIADFIDYKTIDGDPKKQVVREDITGKKVPVVFESKEIEELWETEKEEEFKFTPIREIFTLNRDTANGLHHIGIEVDPQIEDYEIDYDYEEITQFSDNILPFQLNANKLNSKLSIIGPTRKDHMFDIDAGEYQDNFDTVNEIQDVRNEFYQENELQEEFNYTYERKGFNLGESLLNETEFDVPKYDVEYHEEEINLAAEDVAFVKNVTTFKLNISKFNNKNAILGVYKFDDFTESALDFTTGDTIDTKAIETKVPNIDVDIEADSFYMTAIRNRLTLNRHLTNGENTLGGIDERELAEYDSEFTQEDYINFSSINTFKLNSSKLGDNTILGVLNRDPYDIDVETDEEIVHTQEIIDDEDTESESELYEVFEFTKERSFFQLTKSLLNESEIYIDTNLEPEKLDEINIDCYTDNVNFDKEFKTFQLNIAKLNSTDNITGTYKFDIYETTVDFNNNTEKYDAQVKVLDEITRTEHEYIAEEQYLFNLSFELNKHSLNNTDRTIGFVDENVNHLEEITYDYEEITDFTSDFKPLTLNQDKTNSILSVLGASRRESSEIEFEYYEDNVDITLIDDNNYLFEQDNEFEEQFVFSKERTLFTLGISLLNETELEVKQENIDDVDEYELVTDTLSENVDLIGKDKQFFTLNNTILNSTEYVVGLEYKFENDESELEFIENNVVNVIEQIDKQQLDHYPEDTFTFSPSKVFKLGFDTINNIITALGFDKTYMDERTVEGVLTKIDSDGNEIILERRAI